MKPRNTMAVFLLAAFLNHTGIETATAVMAPLSTPELKQTIGAKGKATLVFFQNPYGGPCKMQKEILDKLYRDRKGNFNIASVNAMNQNDQKAFYDYGVRSLPTVLLVDKKGAIARVYPPGIQRYESLSAILDGLK
jgi:thioredoxin-like negative regulator of GroEL